jgi:tetratricopeptide (TPR) repeat protein
MAGLTPEAFSEMQKLNKQHMSPQPTAAYAAPKATPLPQSRVKDEGNKLFSKGAYAEAIEKYQEVINDLITTPLSPEVIGLEVTCRLNIANCCSKLQDYGRAIEECRKVPPT